MTKESKALYLIGVIQGLVSFLSIAFLLGAFIVAGINLKSVDGMSLESLRHVGFASVFVALLFVCVFTILFLRQSLKVKAEAELSEEDASRELSSEEATVERPLLVVVLQFLLVPLIFVCALFSVVFVVKSTTLSLGRFFLAAAFVVSFVSCLMLVFPRENSASGSSGRGRSS